MAQPAQIAAWHRLQVAIKAVDGKTPWQCPFCGASFTSRTNFGLHKDACRKRPAR